MRLACTAAMTGVAVLVAPGTAGAAAARGTAISDGSGGGVLYFTAGAGVANYPTVGSLSDGRIYLNDRAPIWLDPTRSVGCVQAQSNEIHCSGITHIRVYLGDGDDTFSSYHNLPSTVNGQEGNDTIYGWFGRDFLQGGPGDDQLYGLGSFDSMDGGPGNDTIEGGDGPDRIAGDAGNDVLRGEAGADRILGGAGRDMLHGGADSDDLNGGDGTGVSTVRDTGSVYGDDGDDLITVDYSTTQLYGGAGFDTIDYNLLGIGVRMSLGSNGGDTTLPVRADDPPWAHEAHGDLEAIIGTWRNDELTGNDAPNTIIGGGGDDQLWGSDGDDTLDAQDGAGQRITGGAGRDTCTGIGVIYRDSCEG